MDYVTVCVVALLASMLTFFSGFGLGTLLMPAFAVFFPIEVAVAATAVVHLANNILKVVLVGKHLEWSVFFRFAVVAGIASIIGALLQDVLVDAAPLVTWKWGSLTGTMTAIKLVVGLVMIAFALIELSPRYKDLAFDRKWLPLGGAISGVLGGLSGHQGALRAAFLAKCSLSKEAFVATGVWCSLLVDLARLSIYSPKTWTQLEAGNNLGSLVLAGTLAACVGSLVGSRVLRKVTLKVIQRVVGGMLLVMGSVVAAGLV